MRRLHPTAPSTPRSRSAAGHAHDERGEPQADRGGQADDRGRDPAPSSVEREHPGAGERARRRCRPAAPVRSSRPWRGRSRRARAATACSLRSRTSDWPSDLLVARRSRWRVMGAPSRLHGSGEHPVCWSAIRTREEADTGGQSAQGWTCSSAAGAGSAVPARSSTAGPLGRQRRRPGGEPGGDARGAPRRSAAPRATGRRTCGEAEHGGRDEQREAEEASGARPPRRRSHWAGPRIARARTLARDRVDLGLDRVADVVLDVRELLARAVGEGLGEAVEEPRARAIGARTVLATAVLSACVSARAVVPAYGRSPDAAGAGQGCRALHGSGGSDGPREIRAGLLRVAPTGVDPVTFRFSVERSTN